MEFVNDINEIQHELVREAMKSTGVTDGIEITTSKWKTKDDVMSWARDPLHVEAKRQVNKWYEWYKSYHYD